MIPKFQMSNAIKIVNQDGVVIVNFDRPDIRNPLSVDLVDELTEFISDMSDTVSRLIFTGTNNVFASGADLREILIVDEHTAGAFAARGQKLMASIAGLSALTIAAVNGFCYGGALDLALACKVRISSQNGEFCHPGADLGIMTGWGGTQRLPRLIGEAAALEMFLLSRRVRADEALRMALIDQIAENPLAAALNYRPLRPLI